VWIISRFGSQPVAGYTIAIRLVLFAHPSLVRAGRTQRPRSVGRTSGAEAGPRRARSVDRRRHRRVFLGTIGVIFIAARPQIVGIFTNDPVVLAHGVPGLRIISAGFAFYAYGMTFTQSLNGAGATWAPTWLNVLCFWAFELPLAWVLAVHAGLGTTGAYIACLRRLQPARGRERGGVPRGAWKTTSGRLATRRRESEGRKEPASPVARHCASSHQGAGLKPCAALVRAALLALRRAQRGDALIMLGQGITSFCPAGAT
jgi:hypothetical protein